MNNFVINMPNGFNMKNYVRCPGAQPPIPTSVRGQTPECRAQYCIPNIAGCKGMWCPQIYRKVKSLTDISGIPDGRPKPTFRSRWSTQQANSHARHQAEA